MAETTSYLPIEPTNFDLIVVGTGLPSSIIAAAASAAGKSVIHLDSNPFYGSHFSSLPLDDLTSFLHSQSQLLDPNLHIPPPQSNDTDEFIAVSLTTQRMYSEVEISSYSTEPLEQSRKFSIDLAGPRVFFCADSVVDLMLRLGVNQYMEFQSIEGSFVCDGDGKLWNVPDSRKAIFKDRSLGLTEKNQLMRFFKLVQEHLQAVGSVDGESGENKRISEEDLESPFVVFLEKMGFSPKLKSIILYAIAMTDYDQENVKVCKDAVKTKEGISRLALYHSSVGRFPNALGALIYPLHGQGELPQAFCRRAAVKGSLYVLRMAVIALHIDKASRSCKGVKLASGQELFSHQVILDPSFTVPSPVPNSPSGFLQDSSQIFGLRDVKGKVARGICITKTSLKADVINLLALYPPKSLYPEQVTSVRVLQLGSNLAVCPPGMFILYLSALCDNAIQGKNLLHAAINALFSAPVPGNAENSNTDQNENAEQVKPGLLWSVFYIQELIMGSCKSVSFTPMPDGNLNYSDVLDEAMKLFQKMYPHEEFFPETAQSDKLEDEVDLDVES
ncbi:unnamed protein product [Ilex paraguariensis]|uniref:Rab escort protein 1 n=1 Tax=Ilex paraguariensis TaxID=185542 RepID=A0ABC8TCM6_9AQUA